MTTLSEKGKALRELMKAIELSDLRTKELAHELMREIERKEALTLCFKKLTGEL